MFDKILVTYKDIYQLFTMVHNYGASRILRYLIDKDNFYEEYNTVFNNFICVIMNSYEKTYILLEAISSTVERNIETVMEESLRHENLSALKYCIQHFKKDVVIEYFTYDRMVSILKTILYYNMTNENRSEESEENTCNFFSFLWRLIGKNIANKENELILIILSTGCKMIANTLLEYCYDEDIAINQIITLLCA
jgi:hypothetical protein